MSDTKFTEAERAAMKERAQELKAAKGKEKQEKALLDKIAEMPEADRVLAEKLHALVSALAPDLAPKTWYGMPAYADAEGRNVVFFQPAAKFKARYATLGFEQAAKLDDGMMWPTAFALLEWTDEVEKEITALVRRATG